MCIAIFKMSHLFENGNIHFLSGTVPHDVKRISAIHMSGKQAGDSKEDSDVLKNFNLRDSLTKFEKIFHLNY